MWFCAEEPSRPLEAGAGGLHTQGREFKLAQLRTILLLSVEGKIFFNILSSRLTAFLLKNAYIDTSVQKSGVPGISGCLEETGVVTWLIREALEGNGRPHRALA